MTGNVNQKKNLRSLESIVRTEVTELTVKTGCNCLIVAVSGGADSVALLKLLSDLREELSLGLSVCHVEHGIRGEESLRDAEFVRDLCEKLDIPCDVKHVDAIIHAKEQGMSLEEAARELRYAYFEELRQELERQGAGPVYIAVAHHIEDQVETILFQMIRGAGVSGMTGMQTVSGHIFRPMLSVRKEELLGYLKEQGLSYCTDSTNLDTSFARNKIRQQILPVLMEVNASADLHIAASAEKLEEEHRYVEQEARGIYLKCLEESVLNCQELIDQTPGSKEFLRTLVIRKYLEDVLPDGIHNLTEAHYVSLRQCVEQGKEMYLPGGAIVIRQGDYLLVKLAENCQMESAGNILGTVDSSLTEEVRIQFLAKKTGVPYIYPKEITYLVLPDESMPMESTCNRLSVTLRKRKQGESFSPLTYTKCLDYAKITPNLCIRTRRPGDRIYVTKTGTKKLKDYFIDEKIPTELRDYIPLVCDGDEVLWVIGRRLSERVKVTEQTIDILEMSWKA